MKEEKVDKSDNKGGGNVCVVCGDKATGIHYRVQSCEGCKGFWRRTIQRGMGNKYTCKVWTEACPVNPETRGRCQRCRYLACVRAGMVADLVMADKERLSRLRLVDQNRERRSREAGVSSPATSDKMEADTRLLELVTTLYTQLLVPTAGQDPGLVTRAAHTFVECLLFQLMGQRDMREVVASASPEVAAIHLLTTRQPMELMMIPLMSELSVQVASLGLATPEVVLAMTMAATRPRLTWPLASRQELTLLWDLMAGTIKRTVSPARMTSLMQLVHQVQAVTFYIGQGPLSLLPPSLPPTSLASMMYPGQLPPGYPAMMPGYPGSPQPPVYPHMMPPTHHLPPSPYGHYALPPVSPLPPPPSSLSPGPLPPYTSPASLPLTSALTSTPPSTVPAPARSPPVSQPQLTPLVAPVPLYPSAMSSSSVKLEHSASDVPHTPYYEKPQKLMPFPSIPFHSPPLEADYAYSFLHASGSEQKRPLEEQSPESPPSGIPPKKRKVNLYSEILQEAINSTLG